MNRRSVLGSIVALSGSGLAGCAGLLDGDAGDGGIGRSDGDGTWPPPESYDRCPRLVIRVDELPEPARREVETALDEGRYETTDDLYLPHLMDPRESYLQVEDVHYRADVEADGSAARLELAEATPSKGVYSVAVVNRRDDPVTVDVRITYLPEDALLLEASEPLEAGERSGIGQFERRLGTYRAEVDAGEAAETFTWREDEHTDPLATIVVEEGGAYPEPRAVAELVQCRDVWEG